MTVQPETCKYTWRARSIGESLRYPGNGVRGERYDGNGVWCGSLCQICMITDQRDHFKIADITLGPLSMRSTDLVE